MAIEESADSSTKDVPDTDDRQTVVEESRAPSVSGKAMKAKPGASWQTNEEQVLPHNNKPLVFSAIMLTLFLVRANHPNLKIASFSRATVSWQAALDQTM